MPYVQPDYDDSSWQQIDLPHDWAIEGPFTRSGGGGMGMKLRNMFKPNVTKISPSTTREMIVAIFILKFSFSCLFRVKIPNHATFKTILPRACPVSLNS